MTTPVAVDYRTPLLAYRAAVHHARQFPEASTLAELSRAALALPGGPRNALGDSERRVSLLRTLEFAKESPLFPRVEHMLTTVCDLTGVPPRWTRPHETEATANVIRLLAVCHERQADMESHRLSPWTRAAETGTRLLGIILRRTDARPADALMTRTAAEFADRMRTAIVHMAVGSAAHFAEYAARVYGQFPIGPRAAARTNGGSIEWSRVLGMRRYVFELFEPGWFVAFPHGRLTVRSGSYELIRVVALTARTRRTVLDRFTDSL